MLFILRDRCFFCSFAPLDLYTTNYIKQKTANPTIIPLYKTAQLRTISSGFSLKGASSSTGASFMRQRQRPYATGRAFSLELTKSLHKERLSACPIRPVEKLWQRRQGTPARVDRSPLTTSREACILYNTKGARCEAESNDSKMSSSHTSGM